MHLKTMYFSTILAFFICRSLSYHYGSHTLTHVTLLLQYEVAKTVVLVFVRLVQNIRDRYWKSGGIYEFSAATKTRLKMLDASLLTFNSLFAVQPNVLEPLLSYW